MDSYRYWPWFNVWFYNLYCQEIKKKDLSNENQTLLRYFLCLQTMYNTRILYHGVLLLLAAITSTDSMKCSRIIEGTTVPRSHAEGKYHFYMMLFNRTEVVYAYMPNTRYSGKNIRSHEREDGNVDIISNSIIRLIRDEKMNSIDAVLLSYMYIYVCKER